MKVDYIEAQRLYTTQNITLKELAEKMGVAESTLRKRAAKEKWRDTKNKNGTKLLKRKTERIIYKQARREAESVDTSLKKEIALADKLIKLINRTLSDSEQFNRYIVKQTAETGESVMIEQQFEKVDTKALLELTKALETVHNINDKAKRNLSRYEEEKLKIERERLEIEKRRAAILEQQNNTGETAETGVVEMPAVNMADYQQEQQAFLERYEKEEAEKSEIEMSEMM